VLVKATIDDPWSTRSPVAGDRTPRVD